MIPHNKTNPYAWYDRYAKTPVVHDPDTGYWHVFGYAEAKHVLTDVARFSSNLNEYFLRKGQPLPSDLPLAHSLIRQDPPEHTRLRHIINPAFTADAMHRLAPRVEALAREFLHQLIEHETVDLVEDFAYPFPVTVIAELLGIPATDRPLFRRWVQMLLPADAEGDLPLAVHDPVRRTQRQTVNREMTGYFREILKHKPVGLLGDLAASGLAESEILTFAFLLLIAGHVTTTNLLSSALLKWIQTPDAAPVDPTAETTRLYLEEVLRYWSPVQRLSRYCTTDAEIGQQTIHAGEAVIVWLGAANRDPGKFPDPNSFIPKRMPNPHMAFGFGIHTCVGAPLARLEARTAIPLFWRETRLDPTTTPPKHPSYQGILFGVDRLPVRIRSVQRARA